MFQSWPRCWHSAMTSDTQVGIACNSCPFYVFSSSVLHLNFSYQVSSQLFLSLMLSFPSFLSKALNLLGSFGDIFPYLVGSQKVLPAFASPAHLSSSPLLSCPLHTSLVFSPSHPAENRIVLQDFGEGQNEVLVAG